MQIKILGGHGGVTDHFRATSFLIDGKLLLDAGSVAETLPIEKQIKIDNILISHSHLDHIKDLAFLCDNCFGERAHPFEVYSNKRVIEIIKENLFNDTVWPDFSLLPSPEKPTIKFNHVEPEKEFVLGPYKITPVLVQHPNSACGFIIEKEDTTVIFTSDTGPTDKIWEIGKKYKNLKAIFTEVSFPNDLHSIAHMSDHHTPNSIGAEVKKMPKDVPIYLTHLKPNYREILQKEVLFLNESRLHILDHDGQSFEF